MRLSNADASHAPTKGNAATPSGGERIDSIGMVAERVGLPAKTIRYYEDIGLIRKPVRLRNGYRAYSSIEMRELNFIKRARDLGFSIEEVRGLLDLWRDKKRASRAVKTLAAAHLKALHRKIGELQSMRKTLDHLVKHCHGDERPECPILDDFDQEAGRT